MYLDDYGHIFSGVDGRYKRSLLINGLSKTYQIVKPESRYTCEKGRVKTLSNRTVWFELMTM